MGPLRVAGSSPAEHVRGVAHRIAQAQSAHRRPCPRIGCTSQRLIDDAPLDRKRIYRTHVAGLRHTHTSRAACGRPREGTKTRAPAPRRRPRPAASVAVVRGAAVAIIRRAVAVVRRGVPVVRMPLVGVAAAVPARARRQRSPSVIGALAIAIAVRPGRSGRATDKQESVRSGRLRTCITAGAAQSNCPKRHRQRHSPSTCPSM